MTISRRNMIKTTAAMGVAAMGAEVLAQAEESAKRKGRINHAACQWCYKDWNMEELCANAQKLGLMGIDLVGPDWFPTLKKYNLVGTMTRSHGIGKGLNRKENWD